MRASLPQILFYLGLWMFAVGSLSAAGPKSPHVTGFFSDMHFDAESGDVVGTEVWIVYARGGYWATVQLSEGAPEVPTVVQARVNGVQIQFRLDSANLDFKGKVVGDHLVGHLGAGSISLPRRRSYWQ